MLFGGFLTMPVANTVAKMLILKYLLIATILEYVTCLWSAQYWRVGNLGWMCWRPYVSELLLYSDLNCSIEISRDDFQHGNQTNPYFLVSGISWVGVGVAGSTNAFDRNNGTSWRPADGTGTVSSFPAGSMNKCLNGALFLPPSNRYRRMSLPLFIKR